MDAAYSPDARFIATVSKDHTARLWDAHAWGESRTFDWEIGELLAVAFAPDGQTAAVAGSKGKILLFDVE
jgi:WD40 repeat protein